MFKVFITLIISALILIAFGEFKDYALYQQAVNCESTDTTVIIDDLIIENCPWNHVGIIMQDTSGTLADSVNSVIKWRVYDRDFNEIFIYPLDSMIIADSGKWVDRKNFTPPTIGHYADLINIPTAGFKTGTGIKCSVRAGCYYQKVDVRQ